jgi:hypothetical protein
VPELNAAIHPPYPYRFINGGTMLFEAIPPRMPIGLFWLGRQAWSYRRRRLDMRQRKHLH